MNPTAVERAVENVRRTQSPLHLRKESLSALLAVVVWVATLIADNIDQIPAVAGNTGQIIGLAASVLAYGVARFTVPAITKGQQDQLVAEAQRIEQADQARAEAARPATLSVYTGPTVAEVTDAD